MTRSGFIRAAMGAVLGLACCAAVAQQPGQVKLIVGFPAGGPVDAVARAFAEQVRQEAGTTVIVDNRVGASGKIAIDALQNAPADGMTLVVMPASVLELVPMVVSTVKYDATRDFTALGNLAEYGFGIAAGSASGAKDIAAYKAWAKSNGTQSSYATPGPGTPQHFLGAQLKKALGTELTHVPYRGGAAAVTDVMGGQVPLLITTEQLLIPYDGHGKLNPLFITSRQRNPLMPKVPTAKEVGMPQLESTDWFGLFAKSSLPADKAQAWRARVAKVVASDGYREAMKKLGYSVPDKQFPDFAKQIDAERAAWAERVKLADFKPTE